MKKQRTMLLGEVEYNFIGGHRRSSAVYDRYTFWSSSDLLSSALLTSFLYILIIDNSKQKHTSAMELITI